jgi:hypothetical protein
MRAVFLLLLLTAPAVGDPSRQRVIGGGLSFAIDARSDLHVVRGTRRAKLVYASKILSVAVDAARRKVVVDVEDYTCVGNTKHTWTFDHLDARIENWAAYGLAQKKDYKRAIAGFEKAVKFDPTWRIPAYNLASAHQLAGDKAAAVAALAPWLASHPIATYVQVTTDPDLAPLLDRPELAAIRAKQAGNVKVTEKGFDPLYAKERQLVAIARHTSQLVSGRSQITVEIYDARTGDPVALLPLVRLGDTVPNDGRLTTTGKTTAVSRSVRLQTLLADLGFSAAKFEKAPTNDSDPGKVKVVFAKAKLGIVAVGSVANALRGNKRVGTVRLSGEMRSAVFVVDASVVVIATYNPSVSDSCDSGQSEDDTAVMSIKP